MLSAQNEGEPTKIVIPPHLLISKPTIVIEGIEESEGTNHKDTAMPQPSFLLPQPSHSKLLSKQPSTISVTQIKDS